MSHASCSCATSQSSLTSRSSDERPWRAPRRAPRPRATSASTRRSTPRSTRVLPWPESASGELVDVPALDPQRRRHLAAATGAGPPTARRTRRSRKNSSVSPRGAWPRVEDRLAVLEHEHRVAGLVAGQVRVRGLRAEPVVGVVGAHLEGAGRDHEPLAGEQVGEPLGDVPPPTSTPGAPAGRAPGRPSPVRMNSAYASGTAWSWEAVPGAAWSVADSLLLDLGGARFGRDVRVAHPAHSTAVRAGGPWIC